MKTMEPPSGTSEMIPNAPIGPGNPLILAAVRSAAPAWSAQRRAKPASKGPAQRKRLRPRKERLPVARSIDRAQIRNSRSQAPPSPAAPARAPAPAALVPPPVIAARFPGGIDDQQSIPPDISGAVGPNHVFNPLNNNVSIFDRAGTHIGSMTLDGFWSQLKLTGTTFDPRVVYDSATGRFIFVVVANAGEPTSSLYLAVSQTSDPTQGWIGDAIQVDDTAQGESWFDYPCLGVTADKITVTVNLYSRAGNSFVGASVYVFDKQSLVDPPHQAVLMRFELRNQGGTHVPAITNDTKQADQFLVSRWSGDIKGDGYLVVYKVTGSAAQQQAALSRVGFIIAPGTPWTSFPSGDIGPQLGIPQSVDIGDDRMQSVCLRNDVLYCCHTVIQGSGSTELSSVQWWEIDTNTWALRTRDRVTDSSGKVFYANPSLAVNDRGDLLLGMSQFSGTTHPSASYVYRPAGGPAQPTTVLEPGLATYFKTFSGPRNRWGDYTLTLVDPMGDRDFWTSLEFAAAPSDTWGTTWVHLQV